MLWSLSADGHHVVLLYTVQTGRHEAGVLVEAYNLKCRYPRAGLLRTSVFVDSSRVGIPTSSGLARRAFSMQRLPSSTQLDLRRRQVELPTDLGHGRLALDDLQCQRRFPARGPTLDFFVHHLAHRALRGKVAREQEITGHYSSARA